MNHAKLLCELSQLPGISGFEKNITDYMVQAIGTDKPIKKDKLGSISFEFEGETDSPKIMVVGHQDEIGFMVQNITSQGLLQILAIGGWDTRTLMSSPVEVYNRKGEKFLGIISSIPVHHLKGTVSIPAIDDLYVDLGAQSKEQVTEEFQIRLGDMVVPKSEFQYLEKQNLIFSKAFDDRAGIAGVIAIANELKTLKHPNTVFCAGSVQEEVGTRGAQTVANLIKPDVALVLEGAPADDFAGNQANAQCRIGAGVQIRMFDPTMITNPELKNFVLDTADKYKIPYQIAVRRSGGTDAGKIHLSDIGIPSIVLSVPVRYAHSHNGIINLKDFDAMVELVKHIILDLNQEVYQGIIN